MNRRDFLRRTSLLAAAGLFPRPELWGADRATATPTGSPAPRFGEFRALRRNTGIFVGRGGTIGWLCSPEAIVTVDTQFPDTAVMCLNGLPGRGGRGIDVAFNTHHHADHTSGNPVFKPVAKTIVAQANVPKLQFEAAKRAESNPRPTMPVRLDEQVYADATFPEVWRREIGDEVVTAQYHGPAHTSGDAVILFEKANVVHMGDLVFNRIHPIIDRVAGGTVRGWIAALDDAIKTYPADAIYVFGHGNSKFGVTGSRADLALMRDYWSAVLEIVQKEIAAGKSRDEITTLAKLPGFPDFDVPPQNRLGSNLGAAFDELTAKHA